MRRRHIPLAIPLLVLLVGSATVPVGAKSSAVADAGAVLLQGVTEELVLPGDPRPVRVPGDPEAALSQATVAFARQMGLSLEDETVRHRVEEADLPADVIGRLAILVESLRRCELVTDAALRSLSPSDRFTEGPEGARLAPHHEAKIAACAVELQSDALEAQTYFQSLGSEVPGHSDSETDELHIWPVLRFVGGDIDHEYQHDYALQIDLGGNDTYRNNAGGNLLDVKNGPSSSLIAERHAPAVGCQQVQGDFPVPTNNCIASSALLIDVAGDDIYGVKESPTPAIDGRCTDEPLVRRIMTQGAGFAGVGILMDAEGDDAYTGKTGTQGAGHIGGVGILRDGGGDDSFSAVRNAHGFGLVGGVGVLVDAPTSRPNHTSRAHFDFYMPAPKISGLPDGGMHQEGGGGVVDDTGLCDNMPRMQYGAALGGGVGVLFKFGLSQDTYEAGVPAIQEFAPGVFLGHGSYGFGTLGGLGLFIDCFGNNFDEYGQGLGRVNNVTKLNLGEGSPGEESNSAGVFHDSGMCLAEF